MMMLARGTFLHMEADVETPPLIEHIDVSTKFKED